MNKYYIVFQIAYVTHKMWINNKELVKLLQVKEEFGIESIYRPSTEQIATLVDNNIVWNDIEELDFKTLCFK